jgi:hypothetical protein
MAATGEDSTDVVATVPGDADGATPRSDGISMEEPDEGTHKIVDLHKLPTVVSLAHAHKEFHSIVEDGADSPHDPTAKGTISSLSDVAQRVKEYTHHEQRQVESQQKLIHDLMRCVAENHEYIALQQAQLEANTSEIEQMKQLLGGGACCEFVLASRSLILSAIRLSAMHPGPSCD